MSRPSGQDDVIPLTISERILYSTRLGVGERIALNGQFRTYYKLIDGKCKLMITVLVQNLCEPSGENPNRVELVGHICEPPIHRTAPSDREICDLLIGVDRLYYKTDYIPCIAFGENARLAKTAKVEQPVVVQGKFQSRKYVEEHSENDTGSEYVLSIDKMILEEK